MDPWKIWTIVAICFSVSAICNISLLILDSMDGSDTRVDNRICSYKVGFVNVSDKYINDPKTNNAGLMVWAVDYIITDFENGMVYRTNKNIYDRLLKGYSYKVKFEYYDDFISGIEV